jgi:hypothetical protein
VIVLWFLLFVVVVVERNIEFTPGLVTNKDQIILKNYKPKENIFRKTICRQGQGVLCAPF